AYAHDPRVIVEAMSRGLELECSVAGDDPPQASEPGEIVLADRERGGWYDFQAKYTPGGMELVIPARVPPEVAQRVRELALAAFAAAGASGLARVDFFVEPDADAGSGVLVNELNTMPGFTETSVYGRLFEASGVPYAELLVALAQAARERHDLQRRFRY
ncbi:MAG: D-alanine--D-alanine ligase A, partial [Candidatus Dormibacteraeota bacterium]|nr:D-alanine--D-alanine ligase A [Candidatus Dormibacteraeota bacterium]